MAGLVALLLALAVASATASATADPLLDVLIAPADIAFEDLPKALPEVCSAGAALCRRILYPVPELPPTPPRPNDLGQPRLARMKIALNTQA